MKLDHIGIAVSNLSDALQAYSDLTDQAATLEEVANEMVNVALFSTENTRIELLEASDPTSPIAKFIDKKGEGIHHLAFQVNDLPLELQRLTTKGFRLIDGYPRPGAQGKIVAFLHPKQFNGVLIELLADDIK